MGYKGLRMGGKREPKRSYWELFGPYLGSGDPGALPEELLELKRHLKRCPGGLKSD